MKVSRYQLGFLLTRLGQTLRYKNFNRICRDNLINCKISSTNKVLVNEIKKEILKKAAIYEKQKKDKNFKPYTNKGLGIE